MAEPRNGTTSDDEPEAIEVQTSGMLATLNKAEIDVQIATAHQWPRAVSKFKREAMAMATLDEETAGAMFYALPRGGRRIEGPSIRLAEIVGSAWGNLRYGSRVVDIDEHFVTAQGACFDLEKNVACSVEVRRRITDSKGRRYNDDMITVTANAAMSIALRNAIFKVVPFAFVKDIYDAAKKVSLGEGMTMEQRRTAALDWYSKFAKPEAVLVMLGKKGVEDIDEEDLILLRGLRTSIMDGETTWDRAYKDAIDAAQAPSERATVVTPSSLDPEKMAAARVASVDNAPPGSNAPTKDEAPPPASDTTPGPSTGPAKPARNRASF